MPQINSIKRLILQAQSIDEACCSCILLRALNFTNKKFFIYCPGYGLKLLACLSKEAPQSLPHWTFIAIKLLPYFKTAVL